ncbi:MAG: hypothetical protein ABII06_02965 [Pseudomonadota bacterium]
MHYFYLRDIQHFVLYLFPALLGVFVLAAGLGYSHFRRPKSGEEDTHVHHIYADGIVDAKGPFPLVLILIIAGTVLWAFFYILFLGLMGGKI